MSGLDPGGLEPGLQLQIEIRGIDTDEQLGRIIPEVAQQPPAHSQQVWQVLQHLGQAHHRVHLFQTIATLRLHQRAGHAGKTQVGAFSFEGLDECGGQLVAGDLVDRDADQRWAQRRMPRPGLARKSTSICSSGVSCCISRMASMAASNR